MDIINHLSNTVTARVLNYEADDSQHAMLKEFYAIFLTLLADFDKKHPDMLGKHAVDINQIDDINSLSNQVWQSADYQKNIAQHLANAHDLIEHKVQATIAIASPIVIQQTASLAKDTPLAPFLQVQYYTADAFSRYLPEWAFQFLPEQLSVKTQDTDTKDNKLATLKTSLKRHSFSLFLTNKDTTINRIKLDGNSQKTNNNAVTTQSANTKALTDNIDKTETNATASQTTELTHEVSEATVHHQTSLNASDSLETNATTLNAATLNAATIDNTTNTTNATDTVNTTDKVIITVGTHRRNNQLENANMHHNNKHEDGLIHHSDASVEDANDVNHNEQTHAIPVAMPKPYSSSTSSSSEPNANKPSLHKQPQQTTSEPVMVSQSETANSKTQLKPMTTNSQHPQPTNSSQTRSLPNAVHIKSSEIPDAVAQAEQLAKTDNVLKALLPFVAFSILSAAAWMLLRGYQQITVQPPNPAIYMANGELTQKHDAITVADAESSMAGLDTVDNTASTDEPSTSETSEAEANVDSNADSTAETIDANANANGEANTNDLNGTNNGTTDDTSLTNTLLTSDDNLTSTLAEADKLPSSINISVDDSGENLYTLTTHLASQSMFDNVKESALKVFGTDVNKKTKSYIDANIGNDLGAMDNLADLFSLLKGVPNASIDITGDDIHINAPDKEALTALVQNAQALLPAYLVQAEPELDAESIVADSLKASQRIMEQATSRQNLDDLVHALNLQVINFAPDATDIPEENQALLNTAAELLKALPDARLNIIGYTDASGSDEHNLRLSQKRAKSVREYLLKQGVDSKRLGMIGAGESNPIADNATVQGKFRNRRIEFTIVKADEQPAGIKASDTSSANNTSDAN